MSDVSSPALSDVSSGSTQRKSAVLLYMAAAFLFWISLYVYVSTFPTYVASKAENLGMVGVVISMYGLWQAVMRLPLGIASDWVGRRKPFIIGGLLLAGVGALVLRFSQGVPGLIIGRTLTGLAASTWVHMVVVFSGLFPPKEAVKASSMLTTVMTFGRVIATASNGFLNNLGGFALPFYLSAGTALLAVSVSLPNKEKRLAPKRPSLASIGKLIVRRDVLLPSLLSALSQYANWTATYGFIPILAQKLGASGVVQSLLLSLNLVMMVIGSFVASTLATRIGARRLLLAGFALLATGLTTAALAQALPVVLIAHLCIGFAQGISYPVLMGLSIRHVDDEQRTSAMGLHQSVYAIGMFVGPALSGVLADALGIQPMFGVTAAFVLVVGLLGARMLDDH